MAEKISTEHRLVKLGDTDLTVADPAEDVRGRKVYDKNGDEIGKVDDLMIDKETNKVRFLAMESGGFLGIGEHHFLIPVDAITRVTSDGVYIDQTKEQIAGAPRYDPAVVPTDTYWNDLYGYYGYSPYWAPGYVYPAYPYYP
jgi:sporulation protein YlmC with PRC-barrel domain